MIDFQNYKIVPISNKTGVIQANHDKKELLVSEDIKLNKTDDGKLCATFQNFRQPSVFEKLAGKESDTDCSLTISDPSYFDHCIQKDGEYKLSGSLITFNGTDKNDKLILDGNVTGSKINLGDGQDTLAIKSQTYFHQNVINMGNGNDTVDVSGNFKKFCKNQFYLDKGSDKFSASINPDNDAKTYSEFESKLPEYRKAVYDNEIYAIYGYTEAGDKKGWFENNVFKSKTYAANQLLGTGYSHYVVDGADGFQEYNFKPEPKNPITTAPKKETVQSKYKNKVAASENKETAKTKKKLTKEDFEARVTAGNLRYVDPTLSPKEQVKGLEDAWKAQEEYVNWMANPKQ